MKPNGSAISIAAALGISALCGCLSPRGAPAGSPSSSGGESVSGEESADPLGGGGRRLGQASPESAGRSSTAAPSPFRAGYRLDDLQRLARLENPRAEELAARILAAEARVRQASSGFYPHLRSDGLYLRRDEAVAFPNPLGGTIVVLDRESYTQTTSLSYTLWDWGQTRYLHRASLRERAREEAERVRSLQNLDFQVARVFYRILEVRQDLEVFRASVATLEGDLELAKNLRSVGRSTEADVLVVEVNLERRRFETRRLEDQLRNAREELAALLDLPPGAPLDLEEPPGIPEFISRLAALPEAEASRIWEGLSLEHRVEFRALRASAEALEHARLAERSAFLPRLDVFVQHEYSSTESDFRDPNFFSGGVNAGWEIFSGFRTRQRMRELEARIREVRASERALRAELAVEVRRALRSLRRALDGVRVAAASVVRAEENLVRVRERFREDKGTAQEVLEAEGLLRAERARAVRARFQVFRAYAAIRFASGLDFDQEEAGAEDLLRESSGRRSQDSDGETER